MTEDAMTDTEKRDAVLKEYRIDRQAPVAPGITRITAGHDGEAMAAEIVRLRDEIERLHEDLSRANAEAARQRALADFAEHQNAALRAVLAAQEVTP